jgi:ubiquitin-conjugating enzyme E2 A
MSLARRRLMIDLKNLRKENPEGITAQPDSNNLFRWTGEICGPSETEWEGGVFKMILEFSESYPTEPPKVWFVTKMFHPNVFKKNGQVCVDVLQKNWTATSDVLSILISLQVLLICPNPNSPANENAAELFTKNAEEYKAKIRRLIRESVWLT